jgi:hypothetical protein
MKDDKFTRMDPESSEVRQRGDELNPPARQTPPACTADLRIDSQFVESRRRSPDPLVASAISH